MKTVGMVATRDVKTVDKTWTVGRCADLMMSQGIRHVPLVGEEGIPEGMVLDSRVMSMYRRDHHERLVGGITDPLQLVVSEDTPLGEVLDKLIDTTHRAALVVNDSNRLTGIFTEHDAVAAAIDSLSPLLKVEDVSRPSDALHVVSLGTTAGAARTLMLEHGIRHLLAAGTEGELAGVVSYRDLAGRELSGLEQRMHAPLHTVNLGSSLSDAAEAMVRLKVGALPVVSEERAPLGLVTRTDIIRTLKNRTE